MYRQNVISRKTKKNIFLLASWRSRAKIAGSGSGSIGQTYGSADLDQSHIVTDPQHWTQMHTGRDGQFSWFLVNDMVRYRYTLMPDIEHKEKKSNVCVWPTTGYLRTIWPLASVERPAQEKRSWQKQQLVNEFTLWQNNAQMISQWGKG